MPANQNENHLQECRDPFRDHPAESATPAEQDVFAMLSQLLRGRQAAPAALPGMGVGGVALVQGAQLMGSLTTLQRDDLWTDAGGLKNVLRGLKDTNVGKAMGSMDAMTLEIVSLLFDALFEDPLVPEALKGEIGRLQLPMLKVAIADKELFSSREHPARRLLDAFGQLGNRLPTEFGRSHPLFPQLDACVQEVIENFEDDTGIFDAVRVKLEALIASEDARTAARMQATEKQLEQVEGLAVAKSQVREKLAALLAAHPHAPRAVIEFVAEQWIKHLVITRARDGAASQALKDAWEKTDQLLWSVEPKKTPEERRRLTTLIPSLLRSLKTGIASAGINEELAKSFFTQLMACHTEALKHHPLPPVKAKWASEAVAAFVEKYAVDKSAVAKGPSPDEVADLGKPLAILNPFGGGEVEVCDDDLDFTGLASPSPVAEPSAEPALDRAPKPVQRASQIRLPGAMVAGAWVTLMDAEGERQAARLHYVSPLKSQFLFVDRKGNKVFECSRTMLSRRLALGEVVLLGQEPDASLFDRLMEGLSGKLRQPMAQAA